MRGPSRALRAAVAVPRTSPRDVGSARARLSDVHHHGRGATPAPTATPTAAVEENRTPAAATTRATPRKGRTTSATVGPFGQFLRTSPNRDGCSRWCGGGNGDRWWWKCQRAARIGRVHQPAAADCAGRARTPPTAAVRAATAAAPTPAADAVAVPAPAPTPVTEAEPVPAAAPEAAPALLPTPASLLTGAGAPTHAPRTDSRSLRPRGRPRPRRHAHPSSTPATRPRPGRRRRLRQRNQHHQPLALRPALQRQPQTSAPDVNPGRRL